jgi:hypothetical protein
MRPLEVFVRSRNQDLGKLAVPRDTVALREDPPELVSHNNLVMLEAAKRISRRQLFISHLANVLTHTCGG